MATSKHTIQDPSRQLTRSVGSDRYRPGVYQLICAALIWAIVFVAIVVIVGCSPAYADDARCFSRTYTGGHLARHPHQLVTGVRLRLYAPPDARNRTFFKLRMSLRGREPLSTEGVCNGERCFVECDGGGIEFNEQTGIMRLDRVRMLACGSDDPNEGEEITGGLDDRVFRLDRVICEGGKQ